MTLNHSKPVGWFISGHGGFQMGSLQAPSFDHCVQSRCRTGLINILSDLVVPRKAREIDKVELIARNNLLCALDNFRQRHFSLGLFWLTSKPDWHFLFPHFWNILMESLLAIVVSKLLIETTMSALSSHFLLTLSASWGIESRWEVELSWQYTLPFDIH